MSDRLNITIDSQYIEIRASIYNSVRSFITINQCSVDCHTYVIVLVKVNSTDVLAIPSESVCRHRKPGLDNGPLLVLEYCPPEMERFTMESWWRMPEPKTTLPSYKEIVL
ncbi:hypothetical protein WA026_023010 [Henosepilachna vigintioctopunctata]|uniref:Uncharacterized protein n=1 Tax=Henosepilachna vigintioctopunctata TaxID=420089 RepID=A0AAW1VIQ2_9CUCU